MANWAQAYTPDQMNVEKLVQRPYEACISEFDLDFAANCFASGVVIGPSEIPRCGNGLFTVRDIKFQECFLNVGLAGLTNEDVVERCNPE
jgi:hypothetical protein